VARTLPLEALSRAASEDCFIVAAGPSVAEIDFARLRGKTCFGVNGSIIKSAEAGVPFAYHLIQDRNFFLDRFELVRVALRSGAECLFSFRGLSVICEREPALLQGAKVFLMDEISAHYARPKLAPEAFDRWAEADPDLTLHSQVRPSEGRVGFSRDIRKGVFTGQTIVFSAIQIACWLGFRRIFALGLDLGGTGQGTRFYESGVQAAPMRLDRDYEPYVLPAFEVAHEVLPQLGVELYNVSPASRLPGAIVPKISFDEALQMADEPNRFDQQSSLQ
jgi:KDO transferase-3